MPEIPHNFDSITASNNKNNNVDKCNWCGRKTICETKSNCCSSQCEKDLLEWRKKL